MPFVVFAAPFFSDNAVQMLEAVASLPDVRLAAVSAQPWEALPEPTRSRLAGHWRVADVLDASQLEWAARSLAARHGPVHRMFGAFEHLQVPIAQVREVLGIEGMSVETAMNFRDKARMKSVLRAAGLPCARHRVAESEAAALAAAEEVGYPLVVKPPAGAGAQATFRVEDAAQLRTGLAAKPPSPGDPVMLEEFITGEESSFETISVGGRRLWHSLTHYLPSPLDVLRNPWIQWSLYLPREVDDGRYDDIRDVACRTLDALGLDTGLSHMEWFRRPDGSLAVSEVAARPPGAQITNVISKAHDIDFVRAWARVMVYGAFDPPARRYAVGAAYLRGQGRGRVVAVHGLDRIERELGPLVADFRLPSAGQEPTGSYEGEGWILLRHPETEVVKQALMHLVSVVRVELG